MGRDVSWMYCGDADDEDEVEPPALVNFPRVYMVEDALHDLEIIQATLDVAVDAQDNTDILTMCLMLEGVSKQLTDAQAKLREAIL